MPSEKTDTRESAPPEKRLSTVKAPEPEAAFFVRGEHVLEGHAGHGQVGAETVQGKKSHREEDLLPQIRDAKGVLDGL